MAEKVYGIWINDTWWKQDDKGIVLHSPYRNVLAAELHQKGQLWREEDHGWNKLSIEIIGEDGRPEKEEPEVGLLPVAHPCPFCGNGPIDMDTRGCGQSRRVQCSRCNAQGPMAGSDRAAIEEWNTRTP